MAELSGIVWVSRFPDQTNTGELTSPFRENVQLFIASLEAGGASVDISSVLRPQERAYLMHYAYHIAVGSMAATQVPAMAGVDINWVHPTVAASRSAAIQMKIAYEIAFEPSLTSNHTTGRAIDMTITGYVGKSFNNASGQAVTITTAAQLHALGATFGVIKKVNDRPHWSFDGH